MQIKQLYASLEIAEDEIRLLVSEYYMSRFNVLRSETMKIMNAINNKRIEKPQVVSATIRKLIHNAEEALGLKIKKVVLVIPSLDVRCVKRRVNVAIEEGSRKILMSHVRSGLVKAIDIEVDDAHEFVNVGSIKYIVGGISSRTIPLDERCDQLTMDVDLLYADKEMVYSYVSCVEKTGISVLDICLDSFAMAEETACLENSMDKIVILCDLQKNDTVLTLYNKGRLLETVNLKTGYGEWIDKIHRSYHLSGTECEAMVMENCFDEQGLYDDIVCYMWMARGESRLLTKEQIFQCVKPEVETWVNVVNDTCEPIMESNKCKLLLGGIGADIVGIESVLKGLHVVSQIYIPSTIGVREGKMTTCLGALYCVKKWQNIKNSNEVCIEFNNLTAREMEREDEAGFTKKLRNILQVK